jgi:hypothetical protein
MTGRSPSVWILLIAGCTPTAPSRPPPAIDFSAVQLIDYGEVPAELNKLLEDLFAQRVIGRSFADYPSLASHALKHETSGDRERYEFMLPVNVKVRERLYSDELVHHPALTIDVDRKRNVITACSLYEVRF